MGKVRLSEYCNIEEKQKDLDREKEIIVRVNEWAAKDEPPCNISISSDWGFRLFIYPDEEATEKQKHQLLAWVVRHTGAKFEKSIRDDDKEPHWSCFQSMKIGNMDILTMIEKMPLGQKCKIVKKTITKEVSEIVCG